MSNFAALIAAIEANIKTNGNEEITGAVLQDVLKAMVQALGTEAINNLETALSNEIGNRQDADTALGNAIGAIEDAIENGYVYAGIATPSGTPASGKVFYLAVTAGAYTNYGALVVTQGINILKNNGTAWSQEQLIALDNTPTPSSSGLVKSGGVFEEIMTNGSAFDLTVHNSGTTYADLSAALTAMDSLPAAYKKGGMSIKFVQTSDNKYVQYRLMSDTFNTTPANWQGVDDEPTAGSDNLVKSEGVLNKLYNPYFLEIKDENIYQIKSIYLEGINNAADYYAWVFVYNNTKYIHIKDNSSIVAVGTIKNSTLVKIDQNKSSGISGYAILENTDIISITEQNACKVNNVRANKMSEDIRLALNKVDFPVFGNKELFSDYFAGEMYGYPYLIPTQSQLVNEPTLNALRGLSLSGLDNTKKYYLKFNHGTSAHFIDIYDETKTNILARGTIGTSDSLILIEEQNNSGVTGKAKLHFTDAALFINTYTLINTHSVVINANPIETLENEIAYLQNNVFGNALKELYFEGLNQNSEYRIRAYKGSSYTQFQLLLGSGTSNIVAFSIITGNPSKLNGIFELSPINGSNIHGYIYYEGDNIAATTDRGIINNAVVSDMENSPSIKKYEEDNPVIVSSERGYSPSLLRGIMKAEAFIDKKVIVDAGTYDLEAEFKEYYGNDFFTNYTYDAANLGIHLKNRVHVIFSSGAKVVFSYSGDNADIKRYFSPFNAMPASSDCYGFTLENLTLEASNCRYCVHDERNGKTDSYTNKYINCYMKIDNTNNSYGYNCCIGGGLGKNGYIEVRGCRFESADSVNVGALVSWHNSSHNNAKSKIVCHNNYIAGKGTFRFTWHGTSTLMTEVLVDGNSLGANVIVEAETGSDTTVNVNVTQWNNEIRA